MRWVQTAAVCLALSPSAAWAGDFDFRLNRVDKSGSGILYDCSSGSCAVNQGRFNDFATQLGFVLAPRLASPAETLGHAGFHVSAMWSGSFVSNDQNYWELTDRGQRNTAAPGFLQTLQLDVRKGLPFSFELGVNFMWLVDSELFAPGMEVRWALQEGYEYVPDLSLRGAVNHMVGNRDLLLTTVALDAVLSKSFGLFGMINLAPYVGWSIIMIAATSRVIDPTPIDEADPQQNFVFEEMGLTSRVNHKLTFGLRLLVYVVNVSVQGEVQMLADYPKLGLDF